MKKHPRRPLGDHNSGGVYKALELHKLTAHHLTLGANGKSVRLGNLPTASIALDHQNIEEVAILSWRWDVDPRSDSSRNVYVACQEAVRQGVRYLLLDKVTVNQGLAARDMLGERLAFSRLYQELPVIVAYDYMDPEEVELTAQVHGERVVLGSKMSRIMRRPWIYYEVQLYGSNPTRVTYVGYLPGLGCDEHRGFLRMVEGVRESSLCQTVLYTLSGTVGMYDVADFCIMLPQYFDLLTKARHRFTRDDYLLTAALLTGKDQNSRINNDQSILRIAFDKFRVSESYVPEDLPVTQDYYTRYDIYLGNDVVGRWQTRHKLYPFGDLRVWLTVESNTENLICEYLGISKPPVDEHVSPVPSSTQNNPATADLAVVFHKKDRL
jgi:hypothetical protein